MALDNTRQRRGEKSDEGTRAALMRCPNCGRYTSAEDGFCIVDPDGQYDPMVACDDECAKAVLAKLQLDDE